MCWSGGKLMIPEERLLLAMLLDAVRIARKQSHPFRQEVRYWLLSKDCFLIMEVLDIKREIVDDWVERGYRS
jgi:hypothetical protein